MRDCTSFNAKLLLLSPHRSTMREVRVKERERWCVAGESVGGGGRGDAIHFVIKMEINTKYVGGKQG